MVGDRSRGIIGQADGHIAPARHEHFRMLHRVLCAISRYQLKWNERAATNDFKKIFGRHNTFDSTASTTVLTTIHILIKPLKSIQRIDPPRQLRQRVGIEILATHVRDVAKDDGQFLLG